MTKKGLVFNPPPGWPKPPGGWQPPAGWTPDPSWGDPPDGWHLWVSSEIQGSIFSIADGPAPVSESPEGSAVVAGPGLVSRLALLEAENAALRAKLSGEDVDVDELVVLNDEVVLQSVGIYRYHHPLENAAAFKERIGDIGHRIAELVKAKAAIERSNMFTFDNSLAKGRKMTDDLAKLMLRAYNAEADSSIRSLRLGNVLTAKKRLDASRSAIAKLGKMMEMRISDAFHALRLEEIELTADWLMMKQEEKEVAREERARLREERRAEKELAEERERLNKERTHLQNAIDALGESGGQDDDLLAKLVALDEAIAHNDYRVANIRAGYVYVISNRGAFGDNVVKIGLTRRLEPLDRVSELSGASVPFRFDVHAIFFSEDAVTLENELHHRFADRAVNSANSRKEFFFASPAEVRVALEEKVGNLLEFTEHAEATEFLQSVGSWPEVDDSSGRRVQPGLSARPRYGLLSGDGE